MMAERIEDLTSKLSSAERTTRQLKQKLAKAENRQERRSRSLRGGKESLTISKEMAAKLSELEQKMKTIECAHSSNVSEGEASSNVEAQNKSDDCASIFLRLNMLDSKVSSAEQVRDAQNGNANNEPQSVSRMKSDSLSSGYQRPSSESIIQQLKMRLKYTENIMEACKQKLNEVVHCMAGVECQCTSKNSIFELKEDLVAIYEVILGQCLSDSVQASQLCGAFSKMRRLLYSQVHQISKRRRKLKAAGMHSSEVENKMTAEKLALETVVMKYMTCVIHSPEHSTSTVSSWMSELQVFSATLDEMDAFVSCANGKNMSLVLKRVLKSVLSSPARVNAESLAKTMPSAEAGLTSEPQEQSSTMEDVKSKLEELHVQCSENRKALDELYLRKVHVIIESFLENADNECNVGDKQTVKELMDSVQSFESWNMAREDVGHSVVQSEMQNLMEKFARVHRDNFESQSSESSCWCMTEFQDVFLSDKQSKILNCLEEEIQKGVGLFVPELSEGLSGSSRLVSSKLSKESSELLEEAVAIVMYKAIMSGYLSSIEAFISKRYSHFFITSPYFFSLVFII